MHCFLPNLILSTLIRRLQLSLDISAFVAQYPGMWKCFDTSSSGICGNRIHKATKVCRNFEAQVHWQDIIMSIVETLYFLKSTLLGQKINGNKSTKFDSLGDHYIWQQMDSVTCQDIMPPTVLWQCCVIKLTPTPKTNTN